MTTHDKLETHIEKLLNEFLGNKTDWGIEFSSNNSLLLKVVHVATNMLEE